ncbi:MAG: aminomethyl-transferring glycine dehydrogenase subunit GcvPB [Parachlamydiaceae bacterium]
MKTIFEKTECGQKAYQLPKDHSEFQKFYPPQQHVRKEEIKLPESSELNLTRHFMKLSSTNVGVDNCFYPLGSCTMKLNPRINEWAAALPLFANIHPLAPVESIQGSLFLIYDLLQRLCAITGMSTGTLLPNAGAQGEFTGIKLIAAYHKRRKEAQRTEMIIPADAHGTNPASAKMAGFQSITLDTNSGGGIDPRRLKELLSHRTAGLMLTNPNTLGLFFDNIQEITRLVHEAGGLVYYDGANLNALLGMVQPAKMGFDVMHINLHKTFSTPHGGGGPGAGPVLCNRELQDFLPLPRVEKAEDQSYFKSEDAPESIGHISTFYGHFGIYLRAYLYIVLHGHYGLRKIAENAVLNANYVKSQLTPYFKMPFSQFCLHEFVIQLDDYQKEGIRAVDVAKRILDFGMYAPTVYFPLLIKECMLIEPTECESKATLDAFISTMLLILEEIQNQPELVKQAPHHQSVARLNDVLAAQQPILVDSFIYAKN